MKKNIFWGILFILIAVALILNALNVNFGIPDNIPTWKIILSAAFLMGGISEMSKKHYEAIFIPLTVIVMLFEKEIATLLNIEGGDIASTGVFILIAILLTVGTSLIFKHAGFTFTVKSKDGEEIVYTGEEAKQKFREIKNSVSTIYIDCAEPIDKELEFNMGRVEIFFTNTELYDGNGKINIDCNMTKTTVHVPADWVVDCNMENNLGSIKMSANSSASEQRKTIKFTGENNLGKIEFIHS
jgi:predicted membrane protein